MSVCTLIPPKNQYRSLLLQFAACEAKKSKSLLHFSKFVNPDFDLETIYVFRKSTSRRFQRYVGRTKIVKFSNTNRIHFSVGDAMANPVLTNRHQPQTTPSLGARGLPSNAPMPDPTRLTTLNDNSIGLRTFTQLRNKVQIGYNGMPHIYPKTALPFDDLYPI